MGYNPSNPNGQAAMAASAPVVLASDQSAVPVTIADTFITGAAAQTATVNNILPAASGASGTDCAGFRSAAVQVVSTGTGGTFIFEGSNDGTNWVAVPVFNMAILTGTPVVAAITATASAIIYLVPIMFKQMRLRIATTITGGSIQAFTRLSDEVFGSAVMEVAQATAGNLNATVSGTVTANPSNTPNTTPWLANPLHPTQTTIADTGAKSGTFNGATTTNASGKGALFVFNIGAFVGGTAPTITCKLQESADGGTNFVDVPGATTAAITATGLYGIKVYPGIAAVAAANTSGTCANVNDELPRIFRVVYTITGAPTSITITSVSVSYLI